MRIKAIREFIKLESFTGIILFITAMTALIVSNSPLRVYYNSFFNGVIAVHIGPYHLAKPLVLWINDGLMALFFFMVGLEIKWELFKGELNTPAKVTLPLIAAVGGMLFPALIYLMINLGAPSFYVGWAIPTATDIAFALGILSLLGSRVPLSLKIFLTAIAIFDDLGAIAIIAIFYTDNISLTSLGVSCFFLLILSVLNRWKIKRITPYVIIGVFLWLGVLKSGVHATLAGVAIAFAIPLKHPDKNKRSPARKMVKNLHPWIAFFVLPLFAFANAGVSFKGLDISDLFSTLSLGIVAGLFIGKQIGIFGATWLAVKLGFAKLPKGANWQDIYGISLLCGVGFTMSLFIGGLAFDEPTLQVATMNDELVRVGVIVGSILSGTLGYFLLHFRKEAE